MSGRPYFMNRLLSSQIRLALILILAGLILLALYDLARMILE